MSRLLFYLVAPLWSYKHCIGFYFRIDCPFVHLSVPFNCPTPPGWRGVPDVPKVREEGV